MNRMSKLSLWALALVVPVCALSQQISTNNSFAAQIQSNSMMQSNLTQQMINLGGKPTSGSGRPMCEPPYDLQRGPAGIVPPALQGDPRYQQYLRCRYGNVPITQAMANAPAFPVAPAAGVGTASASAPARAPTGVASLPRSSEHLPLTATDFVPAQSGHPVIDQQIASMPITIDQRIQVMNTVNATFDGVAHNYRPNNLAVSICIAYAQALYTLNGTRTDGPQMQDLIARMNDAIALGPKFRLMSDLEKQNNSDAWIFQSSVLLMLNTSAQRGDAQALQQAVQLAQVMMQHLNAL